MINVLTIFGTRPEAIKLSLIIKGLDNSDNIQSGVCSTGQHDELLDDLLDGEYKFSVDIDLGLMESNQTIADLTSRILDELNKIIKKSNPDLILVQGDTTTAFVGALAGFYNQVKVAHVESGLRTGDKFDPYPEEMNRILIDKLSDIHFAPTKKAKRNLISDGIDKNNIHVVGSTCTEIAKEVIKTFSSNSPYLMYEDDKLKSHSRAILTTLHRRESFGVEHSEICRGIREIAKKNPDVQIIMPVHLNPNVQWTVSKHLSGFDNIDLIDPLDYEDFINLMSNVSLVITDSGGIQEEAPSLDTPVIVTRNKTERPEVIESGSAKLVQSDNLVNVAQKVLDDEVEYTKMCLPDNPYDRGQSSQQIVNILENSTI